jgi:hypothetical protein
MRAKNLIGVNNRGLRFGYAFASSPVIEQKNEYICMKIKDISYTLFGILPTSFTITPIYGIEHRLHG